MDSKDVEQVMALYQALLVATTAVIATHPKPDQLRPAFEELAARSPNPHPAYQLTIATLSKAIGTRSG